MPSAYSDISPILMAAYALSPRESRRSSVAFFRFGKRLPKEAHLTKLLSTSSKLSRSAHALQRVIHGLTTSSQNGDEALLAFLPPFPHIEFKT